MQHAGSLTTLDVDPRWRGALWSAVAQATVLSVIAMLMLDLGVCARVSAIALAGQWTAILLSLARRGKLPTEFDLGIARCGLWPIVIMVYVAASTTVGLIELD